MKNECGKKFLFVFEEYQEYNQFEGVYRTAVKSFDWLAVANQWIADMLENNEIQNVEGPFVRY